MNEKEVSEIKRLFSMKRCTINKVYGCYVNENKSIISDFEQSLGLTTEEEAGEYLKLLKKSLSGTLGRNLIDISFSNQQVMSSEEHSFLMKLRETKLEDEAVRRQLYDKIIDSVYFEENYLILLAYNAYDVPYKAKDDIQLDDSSTEVYSHIICSICPVKQAKPSLGFDYSDHEFKTIIGSHLVSNPEIGFLFPAFDDRSTNIYNALCYTRKLDDGHEDFIASLFNTEIPKPAMEQKKSFEGILTNSLGEECSMEVVQAVHESLSTLAAEHKENKIPEPLKIDKSVVDNILEDCGVSEEHRDSFCKSFDEEFGENQEVSPLNIIDVKKFEVEMPKVKISVKPEASDKIRTKIIDGVKYIMIRADDDVQVNGVGIQFDDE